MTFFVEISRPIQLRPWRYASPVVWRVGWLWFAVGGLRVPFQEFCETSYMWEWK